MAKQRKTVRAGKTGTPKPKGIELLKLAQHRQQTKMLLLQNPNYFGTLKGVIAANYKPVFLLGPSKTYYEGLGCIDYDPDTKILGASVIVKQSSGYAGTPCNGGSHEYVRFFVDYDNSGTWADEGLAEIGVYDHPFSDDLCYYAKILLTPDLSRCCHSDPVLPKVRAILSWNEAPTAGNPDFNPVWGEVNESRIQIKPSNSIWCYILEKMKLYPKFKIEWPEVWKPDFEEKYLPELQELVKLKKPLALPNPMPKVLKKAYGKNVPESRIAFPFMKTMAMTYSAGTNFQLKQVLEGFDIAGILDFQLKSKFNTTYEELRCVSLDREAGKLHAAVQVKLSSGYSGNLCSNGSKEYVAFYMDFGGGWEYMGTSHAVVHDIPAIPAGGLWYDVALSVNLDAHRKKWCEVNKAKVRAILSWATPPTPADPDYIATWGDWEECNVELKPLPKGIVPGEVMPVLEKVGGMVVADIDKTTGLATRHLAGSLAGLNSPFYGTIELIGYIFFAGPGWSYRFLLTQPGGVEHPMLDPQTITTDTLGVFNDVVVNPDADGWMPYLQSPTVNVVGGLLGRYGAYAEGMYSVRMQAMDGMGTVYDDVNGAVNFLVDAKAPVLSINLDPPVGAPPGVEGNCADFIIPNTITGTYSMSDAHSYSFSIYVTPAIAGHPAVVHVDGNPVSGYTYDGLGTPLSLPNAGRSGTFEILTNNIIKCGYNVRIDAYDRTIVNSHWIGLWNTAIQGFCLSV